MLRIDGDIEGDAVPGQGASDGISAAPQAGEQKDVEGAPVSIYKEDHETMNATVFHSIYKHFPRMVKHGLVGGSHP